MRAEHEAQDIRKAVRVDAASIAFASGRRDDDRRRGDRSRSRIARAGRRRLDVRARPQRRGRRGARRVLVAGRASARGALRPCRTSRSLHRGARDARAILGHALGVAPADVVIVRGGAAGRWSPAARRLDFNVSHTERHGDLRRDAAAGASASTSSMATATLNVDGVARKFMTPREQAMLDAARRDERRRALLRLWTCKEAMSKATGDALSAPFRRPRRHARPRRCALTAGPPPYTPGAWRLLAVDVPGGFLATVAPVAVHPGARTRRAAARRRRERPMANVRRNAFRKRLLAGQGLAYFHFFCSQSQSAGLSRSRARGSARSARR